MTIKDFLKKTAKKYTEFTDPDNVKMRLEKKVEIEKLRAELEEAKRKRMSAKSYSIGNMKVK